MAKNTSLATYKAKGSAGPLTYSNWKGIGYFKQKPTSVANPDTDAQQNQRGRLRLLVAAWAVLGAGLQTGFREMAVKMSQFNAFMKYNIQTGLTFISTGVYEIDLTTFLVSKGSLSITPINSATANATTDNLTITYSNTVDAFNQSLDDVCHVVIYNANTESWTPNPTTGATRADGTVTVAIKGGATAADVIYGYLYFSKADGSKVSTSQYTMVTAS